MKRLLSLTITVIAVAAVPQVVIAHGYHNDEGATTEQSEACTEANWYCPTATPNELESALADFAVPEVTPPAAPIVTPPVTVSKPVTRTVTYDVSTRGTITSDFTAFKLLANETLNNNLGWTRLGVKFEEVASGGQFTLVLAQASEVPTFSSGCSADYSCNVGRYVIINQDRWEGATAPWNAAGGSLRDYRHMVVNHETGHWLGHGHESCKGSGQAAAVMQQQSIDLQGCKFNPWPLDSEIWSSKLGI